MTERISDTPQAEDIFGGKKLNVTGIDPLLDSAESAVNKTVKFAKDNKKDIINVGLITSSVFLGASNPLQEKVNVVIDTPTAVGAATGIFLAVEEAFEKNDKGFMQKVKAIVKKGTSGFAGGWAGTHFVQGNASPIDYGLITASTITILEETSFPELIAGLGGKVKESVQKASQERDFYNRWSELSRLVNAAHKHPGLSRSAIENQDIALETLSKKYRISVYTRDRKGRVTGVNRRLIDDMYGMMGTDHLLQEEEARALFAQIDQAGQRQPEE